MDSKNIRFKELRQILKLNQTDFGNLIGVKKSGVSGIETGERTVTDQHIKMLCLSDYSVSEEWLRNGVGEPLVELPEEDAYSKAAAMLIHDNDEMAMRAVIEYWKLDEDSKKSVWNFVKKLAEK